MRRATFENWSGEIVVPRVLTATPRTPSEVVTLVNWAHHEGYRVRPRGMGHNWSPLVLANGASHGKVVLVDTTRHLISARFDSGPPPRVTAQTGITMTSLLTRLEQAGHGFVAVPAPGDLTLGGVLAIDGHGTGISLPAQGGDVAEPFGSLSNLILSLTAVVWDGSLHRYALRTFHRSDFDSLAFLTHVGRAFVVEATLQAVPNVRVRCQSFVDIPAEELFAAPGSGSQTFATFVEQSGRVEAIWFPFTPNPWLKVWTLAPEQPSAARHVDAPFNYSFAENISDQASDQIGQMLRTKPDTAPQFSQSAISVVEKGLAETSTSDIWGWSKDVLLYVKPSTLRVTANGYAILTSRASIQRVVNEFTTQFEGMLDSYRARGAYPMNGPVEIRVSGLDDPSAVGVSDAGSPQLSALRPRPDHPEWDVAVWVDILTAPGTPFANQFYSEMESWILGNYAGDYAMVRPEWSKGWGYTAEAAWSSSAFLKETIPGSYRAGQPAGNGWDAAIATLDNYDPYRLFTDPLVDRLMT
jgi:FAD/FMN-containing dehydrogenase